jgi:2-methylisocitrate lyase-like PEP mutase family enzyme
MITQTEKARKFADLHLKGDPLIIFNVWDAGTAKAVADAGAKAVATGSYSVALANGYVDGENIPLKLVLANLERIVASVELPVSLDFEGGYAVEPAELAQNIGLVIEAGAIGINFEDRVVDGSGLYSIEDQCERIRAIRKAAESKGLDFFINARSDVVLPHPATEHTEANLHQLVERASAYAEAGASGFFAPGLADAEFINKLCQASPLPVNILVIPGAPPAGKLAELGVSRISYGGGSYRTAMAAFKQAAQEAFQAVKSSSSPAIAQQ